MLKNLRRKILIQPRLQKKIILQFCLMGVTMILVNMIGFYYLASKAITQIAGLERANPEIYDQIMEAWSDLTLSSLVISLALILAFCLYGLFFSNRIAGPIFNLRRAIARIMMGEPDIKIQFRKDDYFQELSDDMNLLIEKYSNKKS